MFHYKQVNISLNAAVGRLKQTREERDQFHEANNQMVFSLQAKVPILSWLSSFSFDPFVFDESDAYYCLQHIASLIFVSCINSGEWTFKIYWLM